MKKLDVSMFFCYLCGHIETHDLTKEEKKVCPKCNNGKGKSYSQDSLKRPPKADFRHQDLSDSEIRELLLKLRGKLGKRQVLRTDNRLRAVADRPDLPKVIAAGSSSADHMLRIRPWSCASTVDSVDESITNYRKRYAEYFEVNRSQLPPRIS